MEPEEPWEVLDLELEDSILLPCKRKDSLSPTKINKFSKPNNPFLGACSVKSQSHFHSNSERFIPGPAAAVLSAMQRRNLVGVGEEPISTQEYIRRAVEDPGIEDDDFSRDPWLLAVDFVRRQGWVGSDGVAIGTPLSEIKNGINTNKVSQIVAIVKSSTSNGLGDVMVTLKDPTGTIDASIHRRIFTEAESGKDISVGAVLILQKVAVFSPSRSARYLNITLSNMIKVFSKDTETSLKQNYPALTVKHAASDGESEKPWMPAKPLSLSQGKVEGIMNAIRQNANIRIIQNTKQTEKVNLSPPSGFSGSGGSNSQNFVVEKEPLVIRQRGMKEPNPSNPAARTEGIMNHLRQNASASGSVQNPTRTEKENLATPSIFCDGGSRSQNSVIEKEQLVITQDVDSTKEVSVGTGNNGTAERNSLSEQSKPSSQAARGNLYEEIQCCSAAANFVQAPKNENENSTGVKKQLLVSKSVSQWTDEQLDELLSFD
ncbi:Nuclear localized protein [Melia azedarach]|uniref:Nuclear localized protein n=1 Tax=Melia azedarach TaxID=155640 RepID=A0ACC1XTA2_MELAZ|nr:Nuclear localized protein [Melia azedarach]